MAIAVSPYFSLAICYLETMGFVFQAYIQTVKAVFFLENQPMQSKVNISFYSFYIVLCEGSI